MYENSKKNGTSLRFLKSVWKKFSPCEKTMFHYVLLWKSVAYIAKKTYAFCETPLPSYPPRNVVVHCCQASAGPMAWEKLHLQPWESKGIPQCYPHPQEIASLTKGLLTIGIPLLEGLRIEGLLRNKPLLRDSQSPSSTSKALVRPYFLGWGVALGVPLDPGE